MVWFKRKLILDGCEIGKHSPISALNLSFYWALILPFNLQSLQRNIYHLSYIIRSNQQTKQFELNFFHKEMKLLLKNISTPNNSEEIKRKFKGSNIGFRFYYTFFMNSSNLIWNRWKGILFVHANLNWAKMIWWWSMDSCNRRWIISFSISAICVGLTQV